MRVLCALHPHLGLVAAFRRHPDLHGEAVIVGGAPELRLPVVAASPVARAAGVRAGQTLRQAQQLCPGAAFVPLDSGAVTALRASVSVELQRLSPAVEAGDDEVLCDLSGRHAAYASEMAWAAAVARALSVILDADPPAVGVAASRFVARLAARAGTSGRIRRVRSGDEAAFLAPLPLAVLPVDPDVTARLAGFGLDCLGAVAGLAPADLQRQFGLDGLRVHRLARGLDGDGVNPESSVRAWSERLVLDGSSGDLETLLRAARHCTDVLGARLAERGLAASEVRLDYEMEDRAPSGVCVVPAGPVGNIVETWAAVLGLLGELRPGAPVTAVLVEVQRLAPAAGRQTDLWRAGDAAREAVFLAAGRLRARFGDQAVRRPRLALDPGDLPERRFAWDVPAVAGGAG